MARQLRIEYEGAFYHITSRVNQREKIFWDTKDRQRLKAILERTKGLSLGSESCSQKAHGATFHSSNRTRGRGNDNKRIHRPHNKAFCRIAPNAGFPVYFR